MDAAGEMENHLHVPANILPGYGVGRTTRYPNVFQPFVVDSLYGF
jgi:hypothetical protein